VSVDLGQIFGSFYGDCDSLNALSEIKNVQGQKRHNRESKLILERYCVRSIDFAYINSQQFKA